MKRSMFGVVVALTFLFVAFLSGADLKVDFSKEQSGKTPVNFEPMVGTWVVAQDGPEIPLTWKQTTKRMNTFGYADHARSQRESR